MTQEEAKSEVLKFLYHYGEGTPLLLSSIVKECPGTTLSQIFKTCDSLAKDGWIHFIKLPNGDGEIVEYTIDDELIDYSKGTFIASNKSIAQLDVLSKDIFIVHGHDEEMKDSVKTFLKELGLNPIILSEQSNGGKTIIEKFEENSQKVDFAVVLMSDMDDIGCDRKTQDYRPRARQNVILELGYFIGRLGRHKHICVLKKEGVEEPSDILGIVYTQFKSDSEDWKNSVIKDLLDAGFNVERKGVN